MNLKGKMKVKDSLNISKSAIIISIFTIGILMNVLFFTIIYYNHFHYPAIGSKGHSFIDPLEERAKKLRSSCTDNICIENSQITFKRGQEADSLVVFNNKSGKNLTYFILPNKKTGLKNGCYEVGKNQNENVCTVNNKSGLVNMMFLTEKIFVKGWPRLARIVFSANENIQPMNLVYEIQIIECKESYKNFKAEPCTEEDIIATNVFQFNVSVLN